MNCAFCKCMGRGLGICQCSCHKEYENSFSLRKALSPNRPKEDSILFVWAEKGTRTFCIPRQVLNDKLETIREVAGVKFTADMDDEVYNKLWLLKAGTVNDGTFVPSEVPVEWIGMFLPFEVPNLAQDVSVSEVILAG